ncbi:MAG: UDP-N-acetylglucosamine--LPS N-acetylglucosamine transferase [Cyanobacteria bacterium J06626_23]
MKILLVCSSGGHFDALFQLQAFWGGHDRCWITFRSASTESRLTEEKAYWAYHPTNRNIPNLIRNIGLAWQVLKRERPDLVLSTGAGVAVPFLAIAKIMGIQTAFVESITRVTQLSLSARLVLPFLDVLYVHWPHLATRYSKATLIEQG